MSEKRYRVTIEEYDNGGWRLRGCTTAGEADVAGILLGAKGAMDTTSYALILDARERMRRTQERTAARAAAKKQAAGKPPTTTH